MQYFLLPFYIVGFVVGFIPSIILGYLGLIQFGDGTGNDSGLAEFVCKTMWIWLAIVAVFVVVAVTVLLTRSQ